VWSFWRERKKTQISNLKTKNKQKKVPACDTQGARGAEGKKRKKRRTYLRFLRFSGLILGGEKGGVFGLLMQRNGQKYDKKIDGERRKELFFLSYFSAKSLSLHRHRLHRRSPVPLVELLAEHGLQTLVLLVIFGAGLNDRVPD
jgi:hypothetical protein